MPQPSPKVGDIWKTKTIDLWNGKELRANEVELVAQEKVTVVAGTFDAIKIECDGFWQQVFEGSWNGRLVEVFWYAPKIHRLVKSIYKDYTSGRQLFNQNQTELTEYITK